MGVNLAQRAERLCFNVHWKDVGTRFWTARCSLPWWTKQILYHEREEEAETWNNVPVCLTACCCSWCWVGDGPALLGERSPRLWLREDEPVVIWQGWWERKGRLILARWEMLSQCEKSVRGSRWCSDKRSKREPYSRCHGARSCQPGRTIGIVRKHLAPRGSWGDLSVNGRACRKMCVLTGSAVVSGKENPALCEEAGKSFSWTVF